MKKFQSLIRKIQAIGRLFLRRAIYEGYREKGQFDYVTNVDLLIEKKIKSYLAKKTPQVPIISEEDEAIVTASFYWLLDPLDGTTNYIHDLRLSTISLALMENGQPIFAIIHNPYTKETFTAYLNRGSYLNGKRIEVSHHQLDESLIAFGTSPYNKSLFKQLQKYLKRIFIDVADIRRLGSAAYDLALLATGRIDGFIELQLQPYDYAAGYLIVKEAGGVISNIKGEKVDIKLPSSILATNKNNYQPLLDLILGVQDE